MKGSAATHRFVGVDPVVASSAFGLLAGALSVGWPVFAGLAFALSTLTWAGAAGRWSRGAVPPMPRPVVLLFLGVLPAGAWGLYVVDALPEPFLRGLVVGAATLPLAAWTRRTPRFGEAE